jgi:NifU-like protein involved in Fe-S cluster formation
MTSLEDTGAPYSARVLAHFFRPRGAGRLDPGPHILEARVGERRLGAELLLTVEIHSDRAVRGGFNAYGCPYLIAAASDLVEHVAGCARDDLAAWSWRAQAERLEVPTGRFDRLLLVEDALAACLAQWADPHSGPAGA